MERKQIYSTTISLRAVENVIYQNYYMLLNEHFIIIIKEPLNLFNIIILINIPLQQKQKPFILYDLYK